MKTHPILMTNVSFIFLAPEKKRGLTADLPPHIFVAGEGVGWTSANRLTTCDKMFNSLVTRLSLILVSASECLS